MDALVVEEAARIELGITAPRKGVALDPERVGLGLEVRQDDSHPHDRGLADGPAVQKLLRLDERRVVEKVLRYPEERVRASGGLGDTVRLLDGGCDWLLAGDMLARLESGYRLFCVQVGRREQLDGVDVGVFEDLLVAGVYLWSNFPLGRPALGALEHRVAEGYDITLLVLEVSRRIELRNRPAPNDGEPHTGGQRMAHPSRLRFRDLGLREHGLTEVGRVH